MRRTPLALQSEALSLGYSSARDFVLDILVDQINELRERVAALENGRPDESDIG